MSKHSPTRWTTYWSTHTRYLDKLKNYGIVLSEDLELVNLGNDYFQMVGRINIEKNLILSVNKTLKRHNVHGIQHVYSTRYSYHLSTSSGFNLFRYDNAHKHEYLGHTSEFHVHRYDASGESEIKGSPFEISHIENWPTLGEVIWESYEAGQGAP